jgi:hypothetical protein
MAGHSKFAKLLTNVPTLWRAFGHRGPAGSDENHLRAASAWLLAAQQAGGGGGYAHSYHLLHGWQPAYPETTGYIVPTLLRLYRRNGDGALKESVVAALCWLATMQHPDGGFCDLQGRLQVFDTGQILLGFNDVVEHMPELTNRNAQERAARWLVSVQEKDGSFAAFAYNGAPHAYYARVGAALAQAGRILGDDGLRQAGMRNLRWTVAQQQPNGFFRHLSFEEGTPPYLHTMIYVIEGLINGADETGEDSFRAAALTFAAKLRECSTGRDRVLRSQYREDYSVANGEKCLVGLAQWAGVCFRLARETADESWRREGAQTLGFLKSQQILCADRRLHGGLFGSAPPWGRYMRLAIPNWGIKFFVDALLESASAD